MIRLRGVIDTIMTSMTNDTVDGQIIQTPIHEL